MTRTRGSGCGSSTFPPWRRGSRCGRSWSSGGMVVDPAHTWFLYVLLVWSMVLLPVFLYLRGPRGAELVDRMAAFVERRGLVALGAFAVPIVLTEAAFGANDNTGSVGPGPVPVLPAVRLPDRAGRSIRGRAAPGTSSRTGRCAPGVPGPGVLAGSARGVGGGRHERRPGRLERRLASGHAHSSPRGRPNHNSPMIGATAGSDDADSGAASLDGVRWGDDVEPLGSIDRSPFSPRGGKRELDQISLTSYNDCDG